MPRHLISDARLHCSAKTLLPQLSSGQKSSVTKAASSLPQKDSATAVGGLPLDVLKLSARKLPTWLQHHSARDGGMVC